MALPIERRVLLIVGLTVAVIALVIAVRILTGRKWRNRLPFLDLDRASDVEPSQPPLSHLTSTLE